VARWNHQAATSVGLNQPALPRHSLERKPSEVTTTGHRIVENATGEPQLEYDELYIGGQWRPSRSLTRLFAVNPSTEEAFGSFPDASAEDADEAVSAARTSFDDGQWRNASIEARAQALARLAELYRASSADIAAVTTTEMGCPISLSAVINGGLPQRQLDWFAELAGTVELEEPRDTPVGRYLVRREPVGVVVAVVPWNGPLYLAISKVIPALIAGCSVVLKPAPEASLGLLHFAKLAHAAGIPDGVLNVVTAGREVGEHLVTHPWVDRVSFTGSTAAGRRVAALCGERLKRCGLELGGKSAALVLDDAPLPATIDALKFASLANSGQICALQTRILVSERRADEFIEALTAAVGVMNVGEPTDPTTEIGPLVSRRQRARVEHYIESGRREGATLVLGGGRPDRTAGWYVEPTIFTDVTNSMCIAREEIFGPVLVVIRYSTEAEAIALANDSEYGLAGGVWTADAARGLEIARQIRVGSVGINNPGSDVSVPFGGFKASGIGREGGREGLEEYFETKSIALPT
jgi:aldehyde dehydrogenase (NAD+)